jgi:hypothetical protein
MTDTSSTGTVVIERSFDVPVDVAWAMWVDPEHFAAWYGPRGASIPVATMDVRVGGRRLLCMEVDTPSGRHGGLDHGPGRARGEAGGGPDEERSRGLTAPGGTAHMPGMGRSSWTSIAAPSSWRWGCPSRMARSASSDSASRIE